eukprot:4653925-Pyramimonas_sp.AAC.1
MLQCRCALAGGPTYSGGRRGCTIPLEGKGARGYNRRMGPNRDTHAQGDATTWDVRHVSQR